MVLVSEGDGAASALSRYVVEHHRIPSFSDGPAVLRVLESIADSRKGLEDLSGAELEILMTELKADLAAYLAALPGTGAPRPVIAIHEGRTLMKHHRFGAWLAGAACALLSVAAGAQASGVALNRAENLVLVASRVEGAVIVFTLAGNKLTEKLEEKLGDKVSPELKDALKGLFNR